MQFDHWWHKNEHSLARDHYKGNRGWVGIYRLLKLAYQAGRNSK